MTAVMTAAQATLQHDYERFLAEQPSPLSAEERAHLIGLARPFLRPAMVLDRRTGERSIDELRGIAETADGGLRIGAMTTIAEIATDEKISEHFAALRDGDVIAIDATEEGEPPAPGRK